MLLEEAVCYDYCILLAKLCSPLPCFILYSKAKVACYSRCFLTSYFCISHVCGPPKSDGSWWRGLTECGPLENGMAKHLQYSFLENPINSMKKQKDRTLKDELPRSVGAQYPTGDQWRNNFRKNEGMEPKQKQHPLVDGTGDRSKIWCCKERYCIGTWNVTSMKQGTLEMVKQEMARVNICLLGVSKLRWTGMDEFNSDDHYIY